MQEAASDAAAVALPIAVARLGRVARLAEAHAGYLDQLGEGALQLAATAGAHALQGVCSAGQ